MSDKNIPEQLKNLKNFFNNKFINFFLIFRAIFLFLYHPLNTFLVYKINIPKTIIFFSREILWRIFIIFSIILNFNLFKNFIQKNLKILILIFLLILLGITLSFIQKNSALIPIGLKYDIRYFFYFLSGFRLYEVINKSKIKHKIYQNLFIIFSIFIIFNFIYGILRYLFQDIFSNLIGYGPVGNFSPQIAPPIYFRSGPGGIFRLSGFFSGPNDLGYFLVIFLPFLRSGNKLYKNKKLIILTKFFRAISLILTYSRAAYLATILGIFLLVDKKDFYSKIINYSKFKKYFIGFFITIISTLSIFFIQKYKLESTYLHLKHWYEGIKFFLQNPLGNGFGTAGPSFFYGGKILPENLFLQIAINLGIFGLILRIIIRLNLYKNYKNLKLWRIALSLLLFEGIFLHSLENSVINLLLTLQILFIQNFNNNLSKN